jgi:hypothetical protein
MSDTIKELGDELADLLKEQAKGAGADAIVELEEVKAYVAERMTHLASIGGEPGYLALPKRDPVFRKLFDILGASHGARL